MKGSEITSVALTWTPEGKMKVGRPKENGRTVEQERNQQGYRICAEAEVVAQDRGAWRRRDAREALFFTRRQGSI